jgi:hypothetical protein
MSVAMLGAILLLLASFKVCLWVMRRLIVRQQAYEASRVAAGGSSVPVAWNDPAKEIPLKIFE